MLLSRAIHNRCGPKRGKGIRNWVSLLAVPPNECKHLETELGKDSGAVGCKTTSGFTEVRMRVYDLKNQL